MCWHRLSTLILAFFFCGERRIFIILSLVQELELLKAIHGSQSALTF